MFLAKTISPLAYSKLRAEAWLDYVSDMLSDASPRACAELCGVSLKTSWFMRIHPCEVIGRNRPAVQDWRVRLMAGGRHPPQRVPSGQQVPLGAQDAQEGARARWGGPRARDILPQGMRGVRRQRLERLVLSPRGTRPAHGRGVRCLTRDAATHGSCICPHARSRPFTAH